ncbi:MAG: caspase family protein [Prolixibacteraceae bacterium]|nr:caspase family protein [Prolixibacteraceae bacterium]
MKNLYLTLFLLVILFNPTFGQKTGKSSNLSNKIYISIKPETSPVSVRETTKPPYLEISNAFFSDGAEGNRKIDAEETTEIRFELKNSGMGDGKGLVLTAKETNGLSGLAYESSKKIDDVKVGQNTQIVLPIKGLKNLQEGSAAFEITIIEPKGFGTDPFHIEVATQAFRSPDLKIVDYQVSSQNSSTLAKRKPFDLDVLVQNLGQGMASDVKLNMIIPQNIFCLSANPVIEIGTLNPGEKKLINYSLVANNDYNQPTIQFLYEFEEKYKQYFENKTIELTMNQQVAGEKLIVEGIDESEVQIEIASLSSDVDKNIPFTNQKYPNKLALIIGNEDYSGNLNADINVNYARRDAEVFRNYVLNTLGVEERNIHFLTDATAGTLNREIDLVSALMKRMGPETELIFYYAGHGLPDENTKIPYLIPVDVNASNLSSAISLNSIYRKFSELGAKKITVFLDACFSGGARAQSLLAARSVRIKPKEEGISGNIIVFSASSGEQSALPFDAQKHGLFTYFLLKKLKETNGTVTYSELAKYLKTNVGVEALRVNGKSQDPDIQVSPTYSENWEKQSF